MISVIIPTWNEEGDLPRTIPALSIGRVEREILVVDGGSDDRTQSVAIELGAKVLLSDKLQRAAQLNLGAQQARGSVMFFLHADTIVPPSALDRIEETLEEKTIGGGAFARRFDSPSMTLRVTCLLAELRNRAIGWHLGDQGIFVRTSLFWELGGYRLLDRFEDLDFSRRLGRNTRLATLRPPVVSSARRFHREGPWRRTVRDFILTMKYLQGKPSAVTRC